MEKERVEKKQGAVKNNKKQGKKFIPHKTDKKPVRHNFIKKIPHISQRDVDMIYDAAEKQVSTIFDKCTLMCVKLQSGFILTTSSACVSPENYNLEEGTKICEQKIKDQIWMLEGYLLQNDVEIYRNKGGNKNGKSNS